MGWFTGQGVRVKRRKVWRGSIDVGRVWGFTEGICKVCGFRKYFLWETWYSHIPLSRRVWWSTSLLTHLDILTRKLFKRNVMNKNLWYCIETISFVLIHPISFFIQGTLLLTAQNCSWTLSTETKRNNKDYTCTSDHIIRPVHHLIFFVSATGVRVE